MNVTLSYVFLVTSSIVESLTHNGIFFETELYILKGQTTTAVDARAVDSHTDDRGSIPGWYIPVGACQKHQIAPCVEVEGYITASQRVPLT